MDKSLLIDYVRKNSLHKLEKENKSLREKLEKQEQEQEQKNCKICMDKKISMVFVPCGHLISCRKCANALKQCPLCRKPIKEAIKTYTA